VQATVADFDTATGNGSVLLDDGAAATFAGEVFAASGLRLLRSGQRVRVRLSPDGAVTAIGLPTLPLRDPPSSKH
jgi:cold shock CspA family protein